jgi:hypothetical protein
MTAGSWKGCSGSSVVTCKVGKTSIVYATKSAKIKKPAGVTTVTKLDGSSKAAGSTIKVGSTPVRLS